MGKIKIVTRGKRYPRKYKPIRSVSLCDLNGEVVATVSLGPTGIHIDHLEGFGVNVKEMNALGQYQLDGEPDTPFACPIVGNRGPVSGPMVATMGPSIVWYVRDVERGLSNWPGFTNMRTTYIPVRIGPMSSCLNIFVDLDAMIFDSCTTMRAPRYAINAI